MAKFLFLLKGGKYQNYSEAEMQKIVREFMDWSDELRRDGIYYDSAPLKRDGRVVTNQSGKIVDGPFAETKEAVGGFFMIEAPDYERATALSSKCPHLKYHGIVEIREVEVH